MRLQRRTEVLGFFNSKVNRQTEEDSPWVRTYEMAGSAHVDARQLIFEELQNIDELGLMSVWPLCEDASTLPVEYVHSALLSRLGDWIESGRSPPESRLITLIENDKGRLVSEKDSDGNEVGGIHLPQLAVPTGVWSGLNPNLYCFLNGNFIPFSEAELAVRYPWHRDYVHQTLSAVIDTYRDGFLLPQDAWDIYREAHKSDIGEKKPRRRWWRRGSQR
ncbi:MAG: hypothetical protein GY918_02820 [Gammaproteobacteria bacterium]|nr:hypothetical protein [Gammaproteobacteria bacterium]